MSGDAGVRHRRKAAEQKEISPEPKEPKYDSTMRAFLRLSLWQVIFGGLYAAVLFTIPQVEALKPYHGYVEWFVSVQHSTNWGKAHVGYRDFGLVITGFVLVLTSRALLQLVLMVFVNRRTDLSTKAKIRFTEQGWALAYYGIDAAVGMWLLHQQPYGWNASTLWLDFPHYYIDPRVKVFYLFVFGHWLAEVFIIHAEDRRKDHYQMLTHHIVTLALIWGSYVWSYTRIGHLIIIMMDAVDTFLAMAKCSKYLKMPTRVTDGIFLVFLISWVVLRHFLYMYELVYGAFPALDDLEDHCVFDPEGALYTAPIQCFSMKVHYTFFALALALQVITIMWLVMIINVVVRVINGEGAADTRSDDESDD